MISNHYNSLIMKIDVNKNYPHSQKRKLEASGVVNAYNPQVRQKAIQEHVLKANQAIPRWQNLVSKDHGN